MKKRKSSMVEREGINYVKSIIEKENCIFHEITLRNDFGNDAFVEIVDDEILTGVSIALQIKSGKSYCSKKSCFIPADKKHFQYWRKCNLTVVGIIYDPIEKTAYWTDISHYLKNNDIVKTGPYRINIQKDELNRFDGFGFRKFFVPIFLRRPIILSFQKSAKYAYSGNLEKHFLGVHSLFYAHRNAIKTWDIFERMLKDFPSGHITPYLVYFFAHIPGHGDILWHDRNEINKSIRAKMRKKISNYDKGVIIKLLSFIDDYCFERGSIGQNVQAVISIIEDRISDLKAIVLKENLCIEIRKNALILLAYLQQELSEKFLTEIVNSRKLQESKSELVLEADMLIDMLHNNGFICLQ